MFEKFTDRARRVIVLAQEEARGLDHGHIGTEHILLGLLHEGEGLAATALNEGGVSLPAARTQVEQIIGPGDGQPSGHIPFTPRVKKVLELSLREALILGHDYIDTEHILLGLIREGDGVANHVIVDLGADQDQVRQTVLRLVRERGEEPEAESPSELEAGQVRLPPDVRLVGSPAQLAQLLRGLDRIDDRLAAIERHLGIGKADTEAG
jgi:ATP-dependent Clp protease ATP-binding subunit ClpC